MSEPLHAQALIGVPTIVFKKEYYDAMIEKPTEITDGVYIGFLSDSIFFCKLIK